MWLYLILLSAVLESAHGQETSTAETPVTFPPDYCGDPLKRGDPGPDKGIRWYYDQQFNQCFMFLYEGANGNLNNFESERDCTDLCVPMDTLICAANSPPVWFCSMFVNPPKVGEVVATQKPEVTELPSFISCPNGTVCLGGGFSPMGICCDAKIQHEWDLEYYARNCTHGEIVHVESSPATLIGKSCNDGFCPPDTTCEQGQYLAHCCRPGPPVSLPPH